MTRKQARLSEETIDGLEFEARLAANPLVTAGREAYYAKLNADREAIRDKTKDELISALKAHQPTYIVSLLQDNSIEDLQERVARTLQSSGTDPLRELLGLPVPDAPDAPTPR